MQNRKTIRLSLGVVLALAFTVLLLPQAALAKKISKTAMAGKYSVTLKVLPAESFRGPNAAMARDGGAEPNLLHGSMHPNHHLVAFIKNNGSAVEHAQVQIRYRRLSPNQGQWKNVSVVRMHEAGKGVKTTHFGNNVKLSPGNYEAHVTVDGQGPADFHFSL